MGGTRIADLLVKIGADSAEFIGATKRLEENMAKVSQKMTKFGKNMSVAVTAPLTAIAALSVKNADVQMKAEAKVEQAIKSTQGAAQLSLKELKSYASELQNNTIFGDENILNNATAQLLTFTNIAGENFKKTQSVALDLATMLDGDLKSASIQLGKALNDPVKNLSALSRSGIQFSADQKKVINHLAETNRLADAQALILEELNRQYGGQAAAAAKTGLGPLVQFKNAWGDFTEQIGAVILPTLNKLVGSLTTVVTWLQTLSPDTLKWAVGVGALAAAIGPLSLALGGVIKFLPMMATGLAAMLSPVGLLTAGVVALASAWVYTKAKQNEYLASVNSEYVAQAANLSNEELERAIKEREKLLNHVDDSSSAEKLFKQSPGTALLVGAVMGKSIGLTKTVSTINQRPNDKLVIKEQIDAYKKVLSARKEIENAQNEFEQVVSNFNLNELLNEATGEVATSLKKYDNIAPQIEMPFEIKPLPIISTANWDNAKSLSQIQDFVKSSLFGWADSASGIFDEQMLRVSEKITKYRDRLIKKGFDIGAATEIATQNIANLVAGVQQSINNFLNGALYDSFDTLGQIIKGDLGFKDMLNAILSQFAGFLQAIGSQLITFGTMMEGFKAALESIFSNPWAAIAVGAAMVTAGSYMKSLISKQAEDNVPALASGGLAYGPTYAMVGDNINAGVDPEVIAPLSKLKSMIGDRGGNQNVNITLSGELRAKGRDMALTLSQENYRMKILKG